jgi:hypothetical protein
MFDGVDCWLGSVVGCGVVASHHPAGQSHQPFTFETLGVFDSLLLDVEAL